MFFSILDIIVVAYWAKFTVWNRFCIDHGDRDVNVDRDDQWSIVG